MQYDESAALGERQLEQALKAAGHAQAAIDDESWGRAVRDSGANSRREVLADIGLGRRLPAVVARRLLRNTERDGAKGGQGKNASIVIRGTEGMAVQLATCCRPIPGDAILGSMKKGQGLVVHTAECRQALRSRRIEPDQWIDVEWDRRPSRMFPTALRVVVANQRGVLAKVASEIAEAGSNIDSISMEEDRAVFTTMLFIVEVANRQHLARVMRALRRLPEVEKLARARE
jgi:(p)ppGpp synthase/HD superfamily hydrolase